MSEVSSTISEQTLEENYHSEEITRNKDYDLKVLKAGKDFNYELEILRAGKDYRRFGHEFFDLSFDKENCLLSFPVYSECQHKLRKKCSLENKCYSCHSCQKCYHERASEIVCECASCEKEKFPCEHSKFHCNCKLCKKIPDVVAIPNELPVFQRVVLRCKCNRRWCRFEHHRPPLFKAEVDPTHLRTSIYGASAIATHFAQERFSKNHYSDTWKEIILSRYFRSTYIPDNGGKQEKAWDHHNEITKSIHEFQKKYHRFPPCFRERMDIRSITKVSFMIQTALFSNFFILLKENIFKNKFLSKLNFLNYQLKNPDFFPEATSHPGTHWLQFHKGRKSRCHA